MFWKDTRLSMEQTLGIGERIEVVWSFIQSVNYVLSCSLCHWWVKCACLLVCEVMKRHTCKLIWSNYTIFVSSLRYFTEDCPVLLFTLLPLTLLGAWLSPSNWRRAPFWLAVWELVFHSALSHKEHRYVFPIVPVGVVYAGRNVRVYVLFPLWYIELYQLARQSTVYSG